jgi:Uma2 family endonuclease
MTALLPKFMTVTEFLVWAEQQPDEERYELINGEPVAMAPAAC